ncbi:uncharacterized protein LOC108091476 [Drosophila ficusphila]|uniref:uncharacterized protein LOC108091476 n=1 Tax=Drosophila ficusphila TaxID=30025 RepID=UPI0007E77265|nr:uncharacterized protein LOC108091476 [Drosophila ficusphila]
MKPNEARKEHRNKLNHLSKTWGQNKFKPKRYMKPEVRPEPQATAKPWQHVKNDIIDDSEDRGYQDVDSKDAKKFMQQREQNHRRNIIEASRSEATKWESFEDEQPSTSDKKFKEKVKPSSDRSHLITTAVNDLTFAQRNFYRKAITSSLKQTDSTSNFKNAIYDLKKNHHKIRKNERKNPFNNKAKGKGS